MDNDKEIKAQCFPLVARPGGAVTGQEGRPDQLLADAFCPACSAGPDSEVVEYGKRRLRNCERGNGIQRSKAGWIRVGGSLGQCLPASGLTEGGPFKGGIFSRP